MVWFALLCGVLFLIIVGLLVKVGLMRRSADEIRHQLAHIVEGDTNALITISSGDGRMRALAGDINVQLVKLRRQKLDCRTGNAELKNAVTNISHDLRTPLTAISSYLELLEKAEKSETAAGYVEVIKNRTELLISLTDELFRYSVINSPDYDAPKSRVDVKALLEESMLSFYAAFQKKGIVTQISLPGQRVERELNPKALSRVFSNILSNAVKYSGGDLSVTLTEDGKIYFSNTAYGLKKVQAEKLFDRFYTLEDAGKSTGLGLTIAKTLIGQMGGEIDAVYEKGSLLICIRLPDQDGCAGDS